MAKAIIDENIENWVRLNVAAAHFGVKRATINTWIRDGRIPADAVAKLPNGWTVVKVSAIIKPAPRRPKKYKKHNNKPKDVGVADYGEDKAN